VAKMLSRHVDVEINATILNTIVEFVDELPMKLIDEK